MRIHRLRLEAFGPYRQAQEIDFGPLNEAGIFLLTGPTGAGKSTVFEALTFALYGTTTVPENIKGLKSHFAEAATKPSVEVELSIGEHRYLVQRSPAWNRPSARAKAGYVEQHATVLVRRRPEAEPDAEWEVVSTRMDEAGEHLAQAIGLTRQQFAQVVMLPQGRFAQFLQASSSDREELLRRLFPTDLYADAQRVLQEEARAAREELADAARQREHLLAEFARLEERERAVLAPAEVGRTGAESAPGPEIPGPEEQEGPGEQEPARRIDRAQRRLGSTAASLEEAVGSAREVWTRRREETARQREALEAAREHAVLLRRAEDLRAREAEHRERTERLAAAERAEPVRAAEDQRRAAEEELRQIQAELTDLTRRARDLRERSPHVAVPDAQEEASDERFWEQVGVAPDVDADAEHDAASGVASDGEDPSENAQVGGAEAEGKEATAQGEHPYRARLRRRRRALEAELRAAEEQAAAAEQVRALAERIRGAQDAARCTREEIDRRQAAAQREAEAVTVQERLAADAAPARQEEQEAIRRRRRSAERIRHLGQRRDLAERHERAERERAETLAQYERLQSARLQDAAATLAEDLAPGRPCPVCGSREHPAPHAQAPSGGTGSDPAGADDDLGRVHRDGQAPPLDLSPRALQEARQRRDAALAEAQRILEGLVRVDAALEALEADGTPPTPEQAQEALDAAGARVRAAEEAEHRAEKHRGRARRLAQELERLRERLREQELEHRDLQTRGAEAGKRARVAQAQRGGGSRALLDATTLRTRLAAAEDLERLLERVLAGLETRSRAVRRRARCAQATAYAAREAGFADAPKALAQALTPERRDQLRRAVAAEEQERARLEEAWQAPAHRRLLEEAERAAELGRDPASITDPQPRAELVEEAARSEAAAQEEHERILLTRERAQQLLIDLRELSHRWREWARRSGQRAERARRIGDLAEVAAGNGAENLQRMSLTTYVLAAQLEEIAEAASLRLQQMSSGRYTLRHSDAAAGHGRRSGLGLEVFDAWSSVARPTSSLSGGESFMASLCLALGLADVVQARAGGVQIDTLFVDEGFGSLDEDTLEDVMDAIDGLRENGRVIGLISHVADLRARIPQHLRVRRTPAGSLIESDGG